MTLFPQHRPVTLARRGVVAAPHYLAAEAGLDLLKAGGNAIDAAIAASAMLQVVYPFVCGIGGDVFMLIYEAKSGELYGLNGSGRSARAATVERYHELGYTNMPVRGIHTVTVPGCVSGWGEAAQRFGRLGLAQSLAPAISYAEEGFAVGPGLQTALGVMQAIPEIHRSWHTHFLPDGTLPQIGSIMRFPTLARTLRAVAKDGPETFYRGEVAEQIAAFFASEGGLITREDLAAHRSDWVKPLSVPFADLQIYELPPNTQGVTALQMLGMLDRLTLGADPLTAETVHLEVEAKKLAFADRAAYLTDPAHMRIDPEALIDPAYLARRSALIDPTKALPSVDPGGFTGDTIYLCAADREGNIVSLIQSNYMGFGSGVVVDDAGIVLQNRGAYFSLNPSAANVLAPAKRTLHTLIPSLALRNGRPAMVFGTMGGDGQPQTHLQVYTAVERFGLNIQQAIEMPRWVHGGTHNPSGKSETLQVESRFPAETIEGLQRRGHVIEQQAAWFAGMGYAQGILFDPETGVMQGGSDPRAEGVAAGW
ncbi:gamma-glutamyltransferase [Ktedonosporobacter rubrisoli]|uniref:Glutathione hydrolase proenzyme n=1 Tax=Ktedonosporobacter rubrisoli TaxID=2509675 RepID=A0A4P6K431_KTERU|nr:gamma-glutamyltransferase [Ktedonosporobacter rubrisoli]QBD82722.1 gamma-glutamyltransferase [Ktedonosporobacter rubrisoli]